MLADNGKLHAAIIMDGNGRWATARGLPRVAGHTAGAEALRRTVEAAPDLGIGTLTVYAFSSDNWQRPRTEVSALMKLFHVYLRRERARCVDNGVRVSIIGRRDRLPAMVLPAIKAAEDATVEGRRLHLRLAVDYSSREAIAAAAKKLNGHATRERLSAALGGDAIARYSRDTPAISPRLFAANAAVSAACARSTSRAPSRNSIPASAASELCRKSRSRNRWRRRFRLRTVSANFYTTACAYRH